MTRAKVLLGLSVLTSLAMLIGVGCSPQPAYPLWNGRESVADYAKRAGIKDTQITLVLEGNVTMKLTLIPAGTFLMGSPAGEKDREDDEGPQHEVTITKPFYMGIYTVTRGQWKALVGNEPWEDKRRSKEGGDLPATHVSWADALEFCKELSWVSGKTIWLPTEAQWEYACRAGSKGRFSYGDDIDNADLSVYAWYKENAWDTDEKYAHAVGSKRPNVWGLHDMHGNVWEWCADWYGEKYYESSNRTDPTGPGAGRYPVLRGGGWSDRSQHLRSASRHWAGTLYRENNVGFRVCTVLK